VPSVALEFGLLLSRLSLLVAGSRLLFGVAAAVSLVAESLGGASIVVVVHVVVVVVVARDYDRRCSRLILVLLGREGSAPLVFSSSTALCLDSCSRCC
jgi:hypothetical protein